MKSQKIILLCVSFFCFMTTISQESKKKLSIAHSKFEKYAFADAREMYLELAATGYRPADLLMKLGDSYYFNGELQNAFEWYAELITKFSDYDAEYLFRYAQTLKNIELYDEAHNRMKEYYLKKGISYSDLFKNKERNYLELIDLQSDNAKILNFEFNSIYSESSPGFMPDGGVSFSSSRDMSSKEKDTRNNQPFKDLYFYKEGKITKFPSPVNTKNSEVSVAFTKNGDTIYFTRSSNLNGEKISKYRSTAHSKLYRAIFKKGKWKNIKELPFNDSKYSVADPCISPDGKKLFFTSDMPGGFGKMDIYEVEILKKGKFGKPKNVGSKINTIGNEVTPFLGKEKELYFASNGQLGLGGLDIFVSECPNGEYLAPVNLGKPINSPGNDFGFVINQDLKEGYFASNRSETIGDNDIFKFKLKKKLITKYNQTLQIKIKDAITKNSLGGIGLLLFNEKGDIIERASTNENGFYEFDINCSQSYIIRTSNDIYRTEEVVFQSNYEIHKKHMLDIDLYRGENLARISFPARNDLNDILQSSTIYFDEDGGDLKSSDKIELMDVIGLLTANPDLKIEVKGYTDNQGNRDYNHILSLKRSMSIKNYLVQDGHINPNRIKAIGNGELNPRVDCGDDCSENEHRLNRRGELVVVQ